MEEYYTIGSLLTFSGAVSATLLLPAVLLYLIGEQFRPKAKFVAAAIALGLAYLGALLVPDPAWVKWVVAFFNGLGIFAMALSVNVSAAVIAESRTPAAQAPTTRKARAAYETRRRFWRSWL